MEWHEAALTKALSPGRGLGLHTCGWRRRVLGDRAMQSASPQVTPEALIYSTSLNYSPVHAGNPVIIRTSPAVVPIECHYPR